MNRSWDSERCLELLSSPTTVEYHRIETYSSIAEGVRRIRRVLSQDFLAGNDTLIQACGKNDIETVKYLLEDAEKHLINLRKGVNRSALHEAVLHRNGRALARLLCQYNADPRQRDSSGRTPIHYAASCGHLDILIDLIYFSRVSVSSLIDVQERCPLMYACGEGHSTICQWLIENANADYQRKDYEGRSCLIYACRGGHQQIVEWLLPILPPESTISGWHPIHYACAGGHLNIIKILFEYDQQCIHAITNSGHSVLFTAMHAEKNNIKIVKYLLELNILIQLTRKDIEDLYCDKSFIYLIAQYYHSIDYILPLIQRIQYPLFLIRLLLLSEHIYSYKDLISISSYQSIITEHFRNPLKLKDLTRRLIRKSTKTNKTIDLLKINDNLKKFLCFQCLY